MDMEDCMDEHVHHHSNPVVGKGGINKIKIKNIIKIDKGRDFDEHL